MYDLQIHICAIINPTALQPQYPQEHIMEVMIYYFRRAEITELSFMDFGFLFPTHCIFDLGFMLEVYQDENVNSSNDASPSHALRLNALKAHF